ncbi:LutC/YkgG family protein [Pedobacter sp. GR22-6]|uniref:LutC/YkgG family protein n=1 Tax=Pedobacter sp. GR22-6 TaxID=3127957 RepID=UPI00307DBE93
MTSRAEILSKIKRNQSEPTPLPAKLSTMYPTEDLLAQFSTVLKGIGGAVVEIKDSLEIVNYLKEHYGDGQRIISTLPDLAVISEQGWQQQHPHSFEDVDLAVITAHFGVAENSALWITESLMQQRAVPFICQQLAVVLQKQDLLATMHDAYERIGNSDYGFGAFIAGPSKTADIEQSLVLGAHGPKGMTVFIMG